MTHLTSPRTDMPPRTDRWTRVLLIAAGILLAALTVAVGLLVRQGSPLPQGLQNTVPQEVLNRLPGVSSPAALLGDELDVHAEKCNLTDRELLVSGESSWQTVDPRGTLIQGNKGQAPRDPGCTPYEYLNPIPAEVQARTRELIVNGDTTNDFVVWQIVGTETLPEDPLLRGDTWRTEPFRLYVEAP